MENKELRKYLSKEAILEGIKDKVVKFITDPNAEHGTVCQIGEHWFYFGGQTAEEMNPEEYLFNIPTEDIIEDVSQTLLDFLDYGGSEMADEAKYYACYLKENISEYFESVSVAKKKVKDAISEYCTIAVKANLCSEDGCEFCPFNEVYNKVAGESK